MTTLVVILSVGLIALSGSMASSSPRSRSVGNGLVLFAGLPDQVAWRTNEASGTPQDPSYDLWTVDPSGGLAVNVTNTLGVDHSGRWSPDGTRIAFVSNRDGKFDIYAMNADGSHVRRLTNERVWESTAPSWSPDGRHIAFARGAQIWTMRADGNHERLIYTGSSQVGVSDWSPDGRLILFDATSRDGDSDVWSVDRDGRRARAVYSTDDHQWGGSFSPDGKKIAVTESKLCDPIFDLCWYDLVVVDRTGRNPTNITNTPNVSEEAPAWSPDGTLIAFVADDSVGRLEMDLWVIGSGGGLRRRLTVQPQTWDYGADWQPVPN